MACIGKHRTVFGRGMGVGATGAAAEAMAKANAGRDAVDKGDAWAKTTTCDPGCVDGGTYSKGRNKARVTQKATEVHFLGIHFFIAAASDSADAGRYCTDPVE